MAHPRTRLPILHSPPRHRNLHRLPSCPHRIRRGTIPPSSQYNNYTTLGKFPHTAANQSQCPTLGRSSFGRGIAPLPLGHVALGLVHILCRGGSFGRGIDGKVEEVGSFAAERGGEMVGSACGSGGEDGI
eukprot:CCRYP_016495-RA/>CCRYP_016495-RA protein AED:0.29 eAED:0.46 QI:0/0/0/1/0/0/2/0/129